MARFYEYNNKDFLLQLAEILRSAKGRLCSLNILKLTLEWKLRADRVFRMLIGMSII
jgi:hypothetical protein